MGARQWTLITLCVAVAALGLIWLSTNRPQPVLVSQPVQNQYPIKRNVHWDFTVRNRSNRALYEVEVQSFLPLPLTWQQSLVNVSASHPFQKEVNDPNRNTARIALESIPPFGQRNVRLEAELAMASGFENQAFDVLQAMLLPEALIESDHQQIVELAMQLNRVDPERTINAIYDWLVAEIEYSGFDPIDRGALHALNHRSGDCTEYGALAAALARAVGLPARLVSGYVMPENGRLGAFDFHAWAEIWTGDRWMIVDAQELQFDPNPVSYLATHYGSGAASEQEWARVYSPESDVDIELH